MPGILHIVATPIGNLEDITLRAIRILGEVELIAAEDTRRTAKLLRHYKIRTPTTSFHEHNEHKKTAHLLDRLNRGDSLALVSDAGTPLWTSRPDNPRRRNTCRGRARSQRHLNGPRYVRLQRLFFYVRWVPSE